MTVSIIVSVVYLGFSEAKRTMKKADFVYKCFTCLKQDGKKVTYTRSYDLILHMVNTHEKFPVEVRHNTLYAADGSDLRDATAEEIEKYGLAAAHKKRRPEADSTNATASAATRDANKETYPTTQRDGVK